MKNMKRVLLIAILSLILAVPSADALRYRGFVEPIWEAVIGQRDVNSMFAGINTSHGVQLSRNFYVGAGVGCSVGLADYNYSGSVYLKIPVFADFRIDTFGRYRAISFFFDAKIGGYFMSGEPGYDDDDEDFNAYLLKNSLYFQPSIGMRIRLSDHVGLNIAATYWPAKHKAYTPWEYHWDSDTYSAEQHSSYTQRYIGLTFGVDF